MFLDFWSFRHAYFQWSCDFYLLKYVSYFIQEEYCFRCKNTEPFKFSQLKGEEHDGQDSDQPSKKKIKTEIPEISPNSSTPCSGNEISGSTSSKSRAMSTLFGTVLTKDTLKSPMEKAWKWNAQVQWIFIRLLHLAFKLCSIFVSEIYNQVNWIRMPFTSHRQTLV